MTLLNQELLARLGQGEKIAELCGRAGMTREQFDGWWQTECRQRVPPDRGEAVVKGLTGTVRIVRDGRGMPHVLADNDRDLMCGWGYVTAQDRLFQLDYTRRRAAGRLAEILGAEAVESDILFRTLDLAGIAAREWESLASEVRELVSAYTAGINAWLTACHDRLPIEFALLAYEPEPWSPLDSLAIVGDFRWYLTGRFPVIVAPELVKRAVGEGKLYEAFLGGEVDDECILPSDSYPRRTVAGAQASASSGEPGPGSNNWVLAGSQTPTGLPLLASDPHIPFAAVSIWHEVHLRGGSYNVGGVALAGMPGIIIGRNERVAWGVTNNICSQRDLYLERTDPAHPGCFLDDGTWRPAVQREEVIRVRNAPPKRHTVQSSHNGPLVDQLLPPAARHTGPVALRWLGAQPCGLVAAVLAMNRAQSVEAFCESLRPWQVPTFNVVIADREGNIAYHCSGQIPIRRERERGYRPGWDRRHRWEGVVPFEDMPRLANPPRGYFVTANNRIAPDDFAQPLSGTWVTGYRARRIREQLESRPRIERDEHRKLQLDVYSGRAAACVPKMVTALAPEADIRAQKVLGHLRNWDFYVRAESVAAAVFNVFFVHWCRTVVAERLPRDAVELVSAAAGPLAVRLFSADDLGWFTRRDRASALRDAFDAAIDELTNRLGDNVDQWTWGRLHLMLQRHFISARGDLGQLLDQRTLPLGGDGHTINSSSPDVNHAAWLGAGFRFIAELSDPHAGWWSVESGSSSGNPGSPYYQDQLDTWHRGELYYTPLRGECEGPTLTLRGEGSALK